jgi:hypothetical protein
MKFEFNQEDQAVIDQEALSAAYSGLPVYSLPSESGTCYQGNPITEEDYFFHGAYSSKGKINSIIAQFLFNFGVKPNIACFGREIIGMGYIKKFGWSSLRGGQYGYFFPVQLTKENVSIYNFLWR